VSATFGWTIAPPDDGRRATCATSHRQATSAGASAAPSGAGPAAAADADAIVQAVRAIVVASSEVIARQIRQLHQGLPGSCD